MWARTAPGSGFCSDIWFETSIIGRMRLRLLPAVCTFLCAALLSSAAEKPLEIYFVDVEGGQAKLFVTPAGQSLLVDTGWTYSAYRDAIRLVAETDMGY